MGYRTYPLLKASFHWDFDREGPGLTTFGVGLGVFMEPETQVISAVLGITQTINGPPGTLFRITVGSQSIGGDFATPQISTKVLFPQRFTVGGEIGFESRVTEVTSGVLMGYFLYFKLPPTDI